MILEGFNKSSRASHVARTGALVSGLCVSGPRELTVGHISEPSEVVCEGGVRGSLGRVAFEEVAC